MTTPTQSQIRDAISKAYVHSEKDDMGCIIRQYIQLDVAYLPILQSALDTQKPAGDAAEWIKVQPSETYEGLKIQFSALKTMVNSMGQQISHYSKKDYSLSEKRLAELQASLESERAMNEKLTEELDHLASTGRIRGEWRPISEAPRDGTIFYTDKGELAAFIVERQRFEYWMAPGHMFTATHYMPLPAAPGGE